MTTELPGVSFRSGRVSPLVMSEADTGAPTTIVVMGVWGSGKSAVADGLVERLGWEFAEGDDFHPPANVAKMRSGQPLDDDDRWPWLSRLANWIGEREQAGGSRGVTRPAPKRSHPGPPPAGAPPGWV